MALHLARAMFAVCFTILLMTLVFIGDMKGIGDIVLVFAYVTSIWIILKIGWRMTKSMRDAAQIIHDTSHPEEPTEWERLHAEAMAELTAEDPVILRYPVGRARAASAVEQK